MALPMTNPNRSDLSAPGPGPGAARGLAPMLGWRRIVTSVAISGGLGLLLSISAVTPTWLMVSRAVALGLLVMLVYGVLEQWPRRLPASVARWAWQLGGVVLSVPPAALAVFFISTGGAPNFAGDPLRRNGLAIMTFLGLLFAPWAALAAMVRAREAYARDQALRFELEKSQLERQALDARLHLLQAQVQPHFLFNTLANVRELVVAGSPHAPRLLDSLIAYLRAAVPRLDEPVTTLGQEVQLVRAYLDLMQMRMPDPLRFGITVDSGADRLRCPPMTLLTLVENAVRHGIDPSEEGGRIDIAVRVRAGLCHVRVGDSGVGPGAAAGGSGAEVGVVAGAAGRGGAAGLGTGLVALRERLLLVFGPGASLRLLPAQPHGAVAEIDFPALPVAGAD